MGYRWLGYGIAMGMTGALLGAIAPAVEASGRIIEIQGEGASIQRQGEMIRQRAVVGTVMQPGDLIWPTNRATVTVQCRNRNGASVHGTRTRVFSLADVCPDGVRYNQRGRGEEDFLLFLEGRFAYASQVLEGHPRLRWHPVEGVTTYQVQVWDCGRAVFNCTSRVWEETVEGTEVHYGGEALEPGRNYEVRVSDGDGTASAFLQQIRMRRLEAEPATAIQAWVAQLEEAELGAEAKVLALADSYLSVAEPGTLPPEGVGLVLAAIARLEAEAAGSETPYVHRLLGDLYLQVGLLEAAHGAYEQTLSLTMAEEDLTSRAAAQVGLANIAVARGDMVVAELRLRQARVSYAFGGDGERLTQVESWLDALSEAATP